MRAHQESSRRKALEPALRRWAREIKSAIQHPSGWAERRAYFATENLLPVLAECGPGARHSVDGLVVWLEGKDVLFEFEGISDARR